MARNALYNVPPRMSANDLDWIYGRDGATGGSAGGSVTYGGPVPDLTPRPALRGSIDETAPALRGTLGPQDSASGSRRSIATTAGAIPAGRGFAQAVYERALSQGFTDTQSRLMASQAALESRNGQSGLSRDANNFFGIKAGRGYTGETATYGTREENASGQSYREQAAFRKYASPEDSFADYARLLQRRYPDAWNATNIKDATAGLRFGQQGGYATDQNYGSKIEGIAGRIRTPGPFNPDGIRPPANIPNPMGAGPVDQPVNNMATGSNFAPQTNPNMVGNGDLRARPLPGNPQDYNIQQPYTPPAQPQRIQEYFQPVAQVQQLQPVQQAQNAFGGGGDDLVSMLGLGGDMGGWG